MKARPNEKSPRFNADLLPSNQSFWLEHWALTRLLPDDALRFRVNSLINSFEHDILMFFDRNPDKNIPEMVKACKARTSLLVDFLQSVMIALEEGYFLVPCTKNLDVIEDNYKLRFTKKILGINESNEVSEIVLDVLISNHPRMYRYLYDAISLVLLANAWRPEDISRLCVILQSVAYMWESVNLTDSEIACAQDEFLEAASTDDVWSPSGLSTALMIELEKDELSKSPPLYVQDLKRVRRFTDGYILNTPWSERDMAYSLSSSGSHWKFGRRYIPNISILYSAIEPNTESILDDIIGYKSHYSSETPDGLEFIPSSTLFVPKTSSRGVRAVHPNCNARQDRGQYFENMSKHILNDILKCDSTFSDESTFSWIKEQERLRSRVLVCTDIKGATDMESHTFLLRAWSICFRSGIPEGLLELHSGPGLITHLVAKGNDEYEEVTEPYNQISGIKCGTRSNFSIGLAIPHHIVVRLTMLSMGWKDVDPSTIYRLKGDDITFSLPIDSWRKFIDNYTLIANECGFRVHPIEEKGMVSLPSDHLYRVEWSKQIWSSGHLVSRVPHRLFFADVNAKTKFGLILWLAQYDILGISYDEIITLFAESFPNPDSRVEAVKLWNFLIDKKMFGLPDGLRFPTDVELTLDEQFKFAKSIFYNTIENSIYDVVFNNRQRLSNDQLAEKVKRYTSFYDDAEVLEFLREWSLEHCPTGKLQRVLLLNENFTEELSSCFKESYILFNSQLGIFTEDEKILIRKCLPYFRIGNLDYQRSTIDDLLSVSKILKRTQPHSIGKRGSLTAKTIVDSMKSIISNSSVWSDTNVLAETEG